MTTSPYRLTLNRDQRPTDPDVQEELRLEVAMREAGIHRFRKVMEAWQGKGSDVQGRPGVMSLQHCVVAELAEGLAEEVNHWDPQKTMSRVPLGQEALRESPLDVVAYSALRGVFAWLLTTGGRGLTAGGAWIGREIGYDVGLHHAKREDQLGTQRALRMVSKQRKHFQKFLMKASLAQAGIHTPWWSPEIEASVGLLCLYVLSECPHSPIEFEQVPRKGGGKVPQVRLTDMAQEILKDQAAHAELARPVYRPMVCVPKDWDRHPEYDRDHKKTGGEVNRISGGGYISTAVRKLMLVKTTDWAYLGELRHHDLTLVQTAINALQRTPFRVNNRVLEVAKKFWVDRMPIAQLPTRILDDELLPPKPDEHEGPEAMAQWKAEAAMRYAEQTTRKSQAYQVEAILGSALEYRTYDKIYFPYQMDFRGRLYAAPVGLSPQGSDLSKGLLEFGTAKKLGDSGADWLAIHGANCYGEDKVSLRDRIQWVKDHEPEILQCAADPLSHHWWADASKPWQFLAFCFEWSGYKTCGSAWESRLPCAVDGTCNGIQHFTAILRDPVGAVAVNLAPDAKPHDIYGEVSEAVIDMLKDRKVYWAKQWMAFGVDRKTVKRCCMTLPYGATRNAFKAFIWDHARERRIKGDTWTFDHRSHQACDHMAEKVGDAIRAKVGGAMSCMEYLRAVAQWVTKEFNAPIKWSVPSGMVCQQRYKTSKDFTIRTHRRDGKVNKQVLKIDSSKIDSRKQIQAISPNFVHSQDASALVLTVCKALCEGISSFLMVHDSYATHAADLGTLSRVLREAFVENYDGYDALADWTTEVVTGLCDPKDVPIEKPQVGTFDLKLVLKSPYFFA